MGVCVCVMCVECVYNAVHARHFHYSIKAYLVISISYAALTTVQQQAADMQHKPTTEE